MNTKVCSTCRKEKPLNEFYMREKSRLHMYKTEGAKKRGSCKDCQRGKISKNYHSKPIEERRSFNKERSVKYHEKHGGRLRTESRERYAKEKEENSEWYQEFQRKRHELWLRSRDSVNKGSERYPRLITGTGLKETTCMDCKEIKLVSEFLLYRNSQGKIQCRSYCHECRRKRDIMSANKRRALKLSCETNINLEQWERKMREWNYLCAYCGLEEKLTMEHVVPLSRGGKDGESNIVPSCLSCNSKKHTKTAEEFFSYLENKGEGLGFLVINGKPVSPLR